MARQLILAIANDCGKNSPLLDEILNDSRLPNEVKSRIIRDRYGVDTFKPELEPPQRRFRIPIGLESYAKLAGS